MRYTDDSKKGRKREKKQLRKTLLEQACLMLRANKTLIDDIAPLTTIELTDNLVGNLEGSPITRVILKNLQENDFQKRVEFSHSCLERWIENYNTLLTM